MKNAAAISFIIVLGFVGAACSESFLEPDPKSFYTPEAVYVDQAGFEALLVTLRSDLRSEHYGWHNYVAMDHTLSDLALSIEPSDLRNVTPSDGPTWPYLTMFDDAYEYIKNANVLFSRIDDIEWDDQSVRDRLLAEAYFHRAYWFYRLVHTYGDVPWIGEELQGAKVDFRTHSRTAILDKIQEDLAWAVDRLPTGGTTSGAVTQGAAGHLLAKVALANADYNTAIQAATNVINGPYALMTERFGIDADDPNRNVLWDLHRPENKAIAQNTEAILLAIDRPDAPPETRSGGTFANRNYTPSYWKILDSSGNRWCNWSTPTGDTLGIGNADVRTNHFWHYRIWEDDAYTWETTPDLRRADINWVEMNEIRGCHEESPNYGEYFTMDYYGSLIDTFDTWFPWPQYKTFVRTPNTRLPVGGEADWYIFRLAETYLIRAEAHFWSGNLTAAADDINAVRERANSPLIDPGDVTIDYIFDERARELYMEEPRHTEMVRASYIMATEGREGYSLGSFSQSNWFYDRVMELNDNYHEPAPIWRGSVAHMDPHNVLMPIPHSVIEANTQGQINQNEGYDGAHNNVPPLDTIE